MILVTGATGNVGGHLVDVLSGAGASIRLFVHDPAKARELAAAGIEVVQGAFEDDTSMRRAVDGVERVFVLSPPGTEQMVDRQVRVVDAAATAGAAHVVKLSSIAADEQTAASIIVAHRRIEAHIEGSGLAWTHLRSNWFMQNELGQAASVVQDGVFHAPDVTEVSMIDARDVAEVAAAVLTGSGHEGKAYVLTGPEALGYGDVADTYTRVLGRPVRWEEVTLEQARQSMLDGGLPDVLATGFTEIMARYRDGGVTAAVSPDVERLLGRPPRAFADLAAEHLA